ncbi:MAG TPA: hypothetical protein VK790_07690 [Solirubrobacteraceae bacterium]|jgi:hypothetical protein|nr:hypothetical protein [Solirubrobacteraceae bacterium]
MRSAIAATLAVTAGLVAANMLGVASAEAPTTTPIRTVSVEGVATVPIAQEANRATATAVYREGMAAAVADGQNKAEFLTGKVAGTLGAVQSIVEGGGSIECTGTEESGYVRYTGEEPDFGTVERSTPFVAAPEAAAARPTAKPLVKRRKKKKHPAAKKASAVSCTLGAQVSLVYVIN